MSIEEEYQALGIVHNDTNCTVCEGIDQQGLTIPVRFASILI